MKTKIVISLLAIVLLAACSPEITGGETFDPFGKPTGFPDKCVNYSGKYQMNKEIFEIAQKNCEEVRWTWLPTPWQKGKTVTYVPDGVLRLVDIKWIKSYFEDENLYFNIPDETGRNNIQKLSLQKQPCNLMNPTGENYLTLETWIDGHYSQCKFWGKQ
jgi:hypothetical protein